MKNKAKKPIIKLQFLTDEELKSLKERVKSNLKKNFYQARMNAKLYKQSDAAWYLCLEKNTLCTYETGRSEPSILTLILMSNAYGVSIDDLVGNPYYFKRKPIISPKEKERNKESINQLLSTDFDDEN